MTGSGTLLDPYVIWDVNDLQAVRQYDAAYFELGADIDATATAGWFGGAGFEPLDWPYPQKRQPTGDFTQVGNWTVFPVAPATFFDKVNELDQDGDASYIRVDALGGNILFTIPNFNIPAGSTNIRLQIELGLRGEAAGNITGRLYIRVNGTNYETPFDRTLANGVNWQWTDFINDGFSTNPNTGLPWTVDDINGVGPNPLEAVGFLIQPGNVCRITKVVGRVTCNPLINLSFDGKGHSINNLTINRAISGSFYDEFNVGLFRYLDGGEIKNLNIVNCNIKGRSTTAGIVSGSYWSSGGISNCNVSGTIESEFGEVGGIVGYIGYPGGNITNCHFLGTLTCPGGNIGGIAGYAWRIVGGPYTIQNCSFSGTIDAGLDDYCGGITGNGFQYDIISCTAEGTLTGGGYLGGIAGLFYDGNISNCATNLNITGAWQYIGGLVGDLDSWVDVPFSHFISRSSAAGSISAPGQEYVGGLIGSGEDYYIQQSLGTGDITGADDIGGLIGSSSCRISNSYATGDVVGNQRVGGLVGEQWAGTIETSFSIGQVTGTLNVGGLIGQNSGVITNCFWDIESSGQTTSAGGTGKTTAEMKTLATFLDAGWDIVARPLDKNNGYPYLAWQSVWYIFVAAGPPPAISVMTLAATEIR